MSMFEETFGMTEKVDIRAFREMHDESVQCAYINVVHSFGDFSVI